METRHGTKYRQFHIEDYLREIPAEQERVSGVYAHEWITGDTDTNTDFWTDNLLETILRSDNLKIEVFRGKWVVIHFTYSGKEIRELEGGGKL